MDSWKDVRRVKPQILLIYSNDSQRGAIPRLVKAATAAFVSLCRGILGIEKAPVIWRFSDLGTKNAFKSNATTGILSPVALGTGTIGSLLSFN